MFVDVLDRKVSYFSELFALFEMDFYICDFSGLWFVSQEEGFPLGKDLEEAFADLEDLGLDLALGSYEGGDGDRELFGGDGFEAALNGGVVTCER